MGVFSIKVRRVIELEAGDHIKWKRLKGYDHHAIVEEVDYELGIVYVIEYSSTKLGRLHVRAQITRGDIDNVRTMYKYIYDRCDDVATVLERARLRVDEEAYNLFNNNCEHFATWCKTGYKQSSQKSSFAYKTVECTGEIVVGKILSECVETGKTIITEELHVPRLTVPNAVANEGTAIGQNSVKSVCKAGVIGGVAVLFGGALFGYNCYKAHKQYKDRMGAGEMKDKLLKQQRNETIREAAYDGVGAAIGAAVGAAVGSFIPAAGTAISALIGNIAGRFVGSMIGRWIHG